MAQRDYDYLLTIGIFGGRGVGKSQIVNRYVYDTFESSYFSNYSSARKSGIVCMWLNYAEVNLGTIYVGLADTRNTVYRRYG